MIVKLKRPSRRYADLTSRQEYAVVGIEADDFRIINDQGRPYLYPRRLFAVVDSSDAPDWVSKLGEDGERYAYPPPLATPGFFEDFFEGNRRAVGTFWRTVNGRLTAAAG